MRREQFTIGSRTVGYVVADAPASPGRQPPIRTLLFLHAFPLNSSMWEPQEAALPTGWRMIAPDYRGFGASSLPPSPNDSGTSINDLAGDAIDLMDRLHVTDAVVAGCSMGGYVALELVKSAPGYVSGLVLVDTRAGADSEEGKAARQGMLDRLRQGGSSAIADEMTPKLLGETTTRDQPALAAQVHASIAGTDPAAIAMAITAMMNRRDMTEALEAIHVPALVVAGAEDLLIPRAAIEDMQRRLHKSSLETIPLAGHLPNLEQAAAFNTRLRTFLQGL